MAGLRLNTVVSFHVEPLLVPVSTVPEIVVPTEALIGADVDPEGSVSEVASFLLQATSDTAIVITIATHNRWKTLFISVLPV